MLWPILGIVQKVLEATAEKNKKRDKARNAKRNEENNNPKENDPEKTGPSSSSRPLEVRTNQMSTHAQLFALLAVLT